MTGTAFRHLLHREDSALNFKVSIRTGKKWGLKWLWMWLARPLLAKNELLLIWAKLLLSSTRSHTAQEMVLKKRGIFTKQQLRGRKMFRRQGPDGAKAVGDCRRATGSQINQVSNWGVQTSICGFTTPLTVKRRRSINTLALDIGPLVLTIAEGYTRLATPSSANTLHPREWGRIQASEGFNKAASHLCFSHPLQMQVAAVYMLPLTLKKCKNMLHQGISVDIHD